MTWPRITPARRVQKEPGQSVLDALQQPGDYCGPVEIEGDEGRTSVWFLLPTARDDDAQPGERSIHRVTSPPHVFRECPDGSLEIRQSIGCGPQPYYWHGYLDEGNRWRQLEK